MMAMLREIRGDITTRRDLNAVKGEHMQDTRLAIAQAVDPLNSEMHDLCERIEKLEA